MIFVNKLRHPVYGGGGGYPKDDIRWQGGGSPPFWEGQKKDDVIYEQASLVTGHL
jgi:hypothetical protein